MTALNQKSIDDEAGMKQVAVIGSHHNPAFVLKKTPFESSEAISLHQQIHELGYDPAGSYLPDIQQAGNVYHADEVSYSQCSNLNDLFMAASQGLVNFRDLDRDAAVVGIDIRPVSDDSPFFYKLESGIPPVVTLVFLFSLILLLIIIWLFLVRRKGQESQGENRSLDSTRGSHIRFVIFFSMLGIGFMLVEVSLFQKLTLFLGQPVLSLAVLLSALLLGAGLGSLYSGRFPAEKITTVVIIVAPIIVVLLLVYTFALPAMLGRLLGLELNLRLLTAALVLFPLGFFMGFPFPLGMRLVKAMNMEDSIPWIWGLNGIGSVVGSALTILIAISFGFTAALILGAVSYLVVTFTFFRKRRQPVLIGAE